MFKNEAFSYLGVDGFQKGEKKQVYNLVIGEIKDAFQPGIKNLQ